MRNILSSEKITELNELGFIWDVLEEDWNVSIRYLKKFIDEHGHSNVHQRFQTPDGYKLGSWVSMKRIEKQRNNLSEQRIAELEKLGFIWERYDEIWRRGVMLLKQFIKEHGHVRIHPNFQTVDGFRLGSWASKKRTEKDKGSLSSKRMDELNGLGFIWDYYESSWEQSIFHLKNFINDHGHARVPSKFQTACGYKLGSWVSNKRGQRKRNKIPEKIIEELDALGFVWDASKTKSASQND